MPLTVIEPAPLAFSASVFWNVTPDSVVLVPVTVPVPVPTVSVLLLSTTAFAAPAAAALTVSAPLLELTVVPARLIEPALVVIETPLLPVAAIVPAPKVRLPVLLIRMSLAVPAPLMLTCPVLVVEVARVVPVPFTPMPPLPVALPVMERVPVPLLVSVLPPAKFTPLPLAVVA